ncbi:sigma-70 family RNA polymerase sigma factor [Pseudoduganella sp. UC29_106]|uniref:sigma-70 family RNA polymerase sigma factor n=1 Tax=Pseudoduganella sp. UC29_106 TaxID=3374553 RepID=UPI0037565F62
MQRIHELDPLRATELRLRTLLLRGLDGDALAYRRFLQATAPYLRAFLRRRLSRWPDEVEDLVQESLLAIHIQRQSYDTSVPLTAWLYAIARYKLFDWLRRHARHDSLHDPLDDAHEGESALFSNADEAAGEARHDLANLLAMLPEKQRDAIILTKLDGLSIHEASGILQISDADVKVSVHRGLKALAAILRGTT